MAISLIALACSGNDGPDATNEPAGGGDAVRAISVPGRPAALALIGTDVWAVEDEAGRAFRIEGERAVLVGPVGRGPVAATAVGTDLWVALAGEGAIARITAQGRDVVAVGSSPADVVADGNRIWVTSVEAGTATVVDAATRASAVGPVPVPGGAVRAVASGDAVWVSGMGSTVVRLDRATAAPAAAPVEVGPGPLGMAAAGGSIWVAVAEAGEVVIIDEASNKVVGRAPVGGHPLSVVVAGQCVAVASEEGSMVFFDQRTRMRVAERALDGTPRDLVMSAGDVWVAAVKTSGGTVLRVPIPRGCLPRK